MPRLVLFGVILVAAVIIYAVIDCIMSRANEVRSISKVSWVLAIILVPVIGAALWFLFGRPSGGSGGSGPRQPRRPSAPDDDPDFLRNLEIRRRQEQKEAELKAREAELRAREEQQDRRSDDGKPGA
ncbi:PLD nuclease N-terminal domain-containing protein [Arthrobacter zhangbolii]|uniref:PLD nuclease N-terminal domain-containing protein n=1 Tax=Arthrobacter zhangbolii TaxID=2886936 RepID=A0A9X1S9H1_9MICC|nr:MULTISPECIES: PLD nuclease N-terminal domain-containing protein [Arthrobacter]MCC3272531.1 PLD nuclease N-terminal domain-containing protein [Arthrobacter zhangbolii]MDN3903596.1 PLD nuclease N-terminal domain-containing protein [Arthrobacter sp. YD2]UON91617.1 PLD nuclease N-terminal domain-containing protein [Arthrobacter zhangbolii]